MCCRYVIAVTAKRLSEKFNAALKESLFTQTYNAAPGQNLPVITQEEPDKIQLFKWGLLPHWAKDEKIANKLLNARAETILEKPSFKNSFKHARCLVPATGFYEWQAPKSKKDPYKTPFHIHLKNNDIFAFAGLYSIWHKDKKDETATFNIITTKPNSLVEKIHNRMPVILKKEDYAKWLNPNIPPEEAHDLLKPLNARALQAHEVSRKVNSPKNNTPDLIEALT